MWWIWLVPSIVVAGALTAVAAGGVEVWRRVRRVRRQLAELTAAASRLESVTAEVSAAAERVSARRPDR